MLLENLIVQSKTVDAEFPGTEGFVVTLAYLTREELVKLRKKATTTKINRRTRQPEEEIDSDLFQEVYISAVVKGWKGLKYRFLPKFLPVDLSTIVDKETELEFSKENAVALMKNSPEFDTWVTSMLDDLENFTA